MNEPTFNDFLWAQEKVQQLLAPLVTPAAEQAQFQAMLDEAFRVELERLNAQNQKRP